VAIVFRTVNEQPTLRDAIDHPAALQLRLLETVVEVAAEKNSTLVLAFPVELLRFLERATPPTSGSDNAVASPPESGVDDNNDTMMLASPPIADDPRILGLDTHIATFGTIAEQELVASARETNR
jgi:hypothetical protein